ncbi:MAG: sugar ABC transporter ATP-binding protein, partial [Terrimicrobiaceae bacterium]
RIRWAERRSHARGLLKRIGAEIDPDTEVRKLSMPEQQLVEIARSLGAGARILIMDEPTASLTQKEVHLLYAVVRDLRAQGVGVVYISHRMEEIFALADRITVLRDGESIATQETKGMKESTLIKLMVGREVSTLYPPSETSPANVALSLRDIGCKASGIHDVNLDLRAGEVVGFAGIVGAGRTELARVLFGITPADTGTISLGGKSVSVQSPREAVEHGIGYVPEDRRRHGVILEMPIASNMTMSIHPTFFPGSWLRFGAERDLANGYIRDLGVKTPSPDVPGGALSGGNQQKVSLSRWLATKPKVLILDEPTQGVDVGAKSEIHKIIRRLTKEGLAVMMISSDLAEVLGMSDRIAVMHGGTILREFKASEANAHDVMAAALGQKGSTGKEGPENAQTDG